MKYTKDLVVKVNELFHDITAEYYDQKHSKSFFDEYRRWRNFGKFYLANNSEKIILLDFGTGTGFIPQTIADFLKKDDLFICADLSAKILELCKKKVEKRNFSCIFKYIKLNGNNVNLESNQCDFITINSVIHHIPDFSQVFKVFDRLLKENGFLVIAHEPNRFFTKNKFLFLNFRFIALIFNKKRILPTFFRKLKFFEISRFFENKFKTKSFIPTNIEENLNKRLFNLKLIDMPLTLKAINEMVDIQSPTAAGYHYDRGIDILKISNKYLPNFKVEYFETYNHLGKVTNKNRFTKLYNSILKRIFPKSGATFYIILKKVKN